MPMKTEKPISCIICAIYDELCKDDIMVTKIIMGREVYADFMLNKTSIDRQEDDNFVGGIPVELGYFDDGYILWTEKETDASNKEELMLVLDSIIHRELRDSKGE